MTKNQKTVKMSRVKSQKTNRSEWKNDRSGWQMWGITLFGRSKVELLTKLEELSVSKNIKTWIATVNPEFLMMAEKDPKFKQILQNRTSVNVVDGIGLVWARVIEARNKKHDSRIKKIMMGLKTGMEILRGRHREMLVTGADLIDDLCGLAQRRKMTVYFYGGWDDRAQRTADYFVKKYPGLKVVGARAEDFDFKTEVDFLFVCRAMKKQEEWIEANWDKLKCRVVIGLGRTFDYYSGELSRAPEWMRRMGLEWLYSWVFDASRRKRKWELVRFVGKILFE